MSQEEIDRLHEDMVQLAEALWNVYEAGGDLGPEAVLDLVEHVLALDERLRQGGPLPGAWRKAP